MMVIATSWPGVLGASSTSTPSLPANAAMVVSTVCNDTVVAPGPQPPMEVQSQGKCRAGSRILSQGNGLKSRQAGHQRNVTVGHRTAIAYLTVFITAKGVDFRLVGQQQNGLFAHRDLPETTIDLIGIILGYRPTYPLV